MSIRKGTVTLTAPLRHGSVTSWNKNLWLSLSHHYEGKGAQYTL